MMRLIYTHPISNVPVAGIRLGPGAIVREDDCYSCEDGSWRTSLNFVHTMVRPGTGTVWIRTAGLGSTARELLERLILDGHYMTKFGGREWKKIPSPDKKADDRLTWAIHQDAADELLRTGLITAMNGGDSDVVFEVSTTGRTLLCVK